MIIDIEKILYSPIERYIWTETSAGSLKIFLGAFPCPIYFVSRTKCKHMAPMETLTLKNSTASKVIRFN